VKKLHACGALYAPERVGIEASGSVHYSARVMEGHGYPVRLPQFPSLARVCKPCADGPKFMQRLVAKQKARVKDS